MNDEQIYSILKGISLSMNVSIKVGLQPTSFIFHVWSIKCQKNLKNIN